MSVSIGAAPGGAAVSPPFSTPSLRRRFAVMLYESLVLFGVLTMAGLLYSPLMEQRHALQGRQGLQAVLFAVLGLYFVWFWTHGGQTVAMRAWHVQLVDRHGAPVGLWRALARFMASWIWLMPAFLSIYLTQWQGHPSLALYATLTACALALWMVAYALSSRLHPEGQFWHDTLCGTRLVRTAETATSSGHNARP
jgi:uncharacterized RDD family membrane protein YckC